MRRYFITMAAMVMMFALTSCSTIANQVRGDIQDAPDAAEEQAAELEDRLQRIEDLLQGIEGAVEVTEDSVVRTVERAEDNGPRAEDSEEDAEDSGERTVDSGEESAVGQDERGTASFSGDIVTDLTDVANYWVELDGIRYNVGDPVSVLSHFYQVASQQERMEEVLPENRYTSVSFSNGEVWGSGSIRAFVANTTNRDILVREGTIIGFSFGQTDMGDWEQVSFINGIRLDVTTEQEIIAMFGEPDSVNEATSTKTLQYNPGGGLAGHRINYRFTVDIDTGLLVGIRLMFSD